jgi:ATP-dependent RNA helicase RhlE
MVKKMLFKELNLIPQLERAITKQGYTKPTPIQLKSIPSLLLGKDLIGIAQTGTGKTAAFVLPILQRMIIKNPRAIKTLVLAPTRELAAQIGESFSVYGEFLKFRHTVIFGGVRQGKQVRELNNGVDIVVATPGRLLDLMNQRKLTLKDIEFFVLDEADRMLDMGFIHDIKKIIERLPRERQTLFFSATMSPEINQLAKKLLKDPVHVEVAPQATTVELVKQQIFFVDQSSKEKLLLELLKQKHLTSVLIFTRTKHRANKLALFLNKNKISSDAIHGNKSQNARTKAITDFKKGRVKVLVATDIAARGIDIDNISHVINFELPNEPESYVHRIGRTARAGTEGTAFSFCAADERNFLRDIERLIREKIEVMDHKFHSESAKNAVGAAAKPLPRKQFNRNSRFKGKSGSKNKKSFSKSNSSRTKYKPKRR